MTIGFQSVGVGGNGVFFCRSEKTERNRNVETVEAQNIVLVCQVRGIVYSLHVFPHPFDFRYVLHIDENFSG